LAETFGANSMDGMIECKPTGEVIKDLDFRASNKRWQYPWQLVHRVELHDTLKKAATGKEGPGIPAVLRTASRGISVDADAGILTLENGSSIHADVVIGADGVYVSK
jgi:2-polyprenyl-6-methoxyphenol hydroxylase-like FAD-dependent oxidoreductase